MKKRRLSILLSIVMLFSLLPTTALAAGNPDSASVSVDGGKSFSSSNLYYKNGDSACSNDSTGYNAAYNPTNGTLTLKDYEGGSITLGGDIQRNLTIKLIGDNKITVSGDSGIVVNSYECNITITAESGSKGELTIDVSNATSDNYGVTGIGNYLATGGGTSGNVTIAGYADVTINATTNAANWSSWGIYAGEVFIEDHAKVAITVNAPNNTGGDFVYGIYANTNVTINTAGEITVDASNAGTGDRVYSIGVKAMGTLTLTKVGRMTVKWNNNQGRNGHPLSQNVEFDPTAYDNNVDKTNCIATYTPKVATANISLDKTGTVDFGNMEAGYTTAPAEQTVTITNNGTAATGELAITLDGANKTDFTLSPTNIADVAAGGGTGTFTVQPKTGLNAGTYTATVKVSGTGVTEQSFDVQFTVTAPVPSATVGDVTITGTVGQNFTDQDVVITLVNDKFKSLPTVGGSVRDLFPDLSDTALIAKLKSVNEDANRTVLTATISGVADKEINKVMDIVIPADRLESGNALTVTTNPKAKFAIKKVSLPTSLKIYKEDGTVVTTDTLTTGSTAQSVKYIAKVYDQYGEMLSGSYTINWALIPSGALSMIGSNPTQQMELQLAANADAGTYTLTATLGGTEIKNSITIEVIQPEARLLTAPSGKTGLKYNGTDQELLATPGTAQNGTLRYRVDPPSTGSYSEEMPKAKDTKTYKVWYYVKGNAGYADTAYERIDVKIEKGDVEVSNIQVTSPAEITTDTNINDIKFSCDAVIAGTTLKAGGELRLSGGQSLSAGTKEYNLTFLPTLTSDLNVKSFIKYSLTVKAPEHNITVSSDGNGTATASLAKAPAGTAITLTATPNAGYHFKAWKVVNGGVTLANENSATTTFTMPAKAVEIKAIFEKNASFGGYVPTVQKPEITIIGSGKADLSADGRTATITANAGHELVSVVLNGKEMGKVEKLTGLKTGDKATITFQAKTDGKAEMDKIIAQKASKLKLMARSAKTAKKNIKVVVKGDLKAITDAGYTVKYKFYRSTKKSAGYKAVLTKKAPTYYNTYGKKGTMYYYKARVMIYDKDGNFVAQTALKQCKYANRLWTK